jgi:tripartite-type tricarboxylate transporter receptor subunit TctC
VHLLGEMLRLSLALGIVHVPFNGAGREIASIVAGHTPIGWSALSSAAQQIKARSTAGAGGDEQDSLAALSRYTHDG